MTDDEIGIETEIAGLLDELAGELNGIAEQLRRKPFAAIEPQLLGYHIRMGFIGKAGQLLMEGRLDEARTNLRWVNDDEIVERWRQAIQFSKQLRAQWAEQRRQGEAEAEPCKA